MFQVRVDRLWFVDGFSDEVEELCDALYILIKK